MMTREQWLAIKAKAPKRIERFRKRSRKQLPCVHLGDRTEFRADCASGWTSRHLCTLYGKREDVTKHLDEHGPQAGQTNETIPGESCLRCPGRETKKAAQ